MIGIRHLAIAASSSGDTTLLAAQSGQPIVVLAYTLVCDAAVDVKFRDGQDLTGAMPFASNGGVSAPFNPAGHFVTRAGQPLVINLSEAAAIAGHMTVQVGGGLRF